MTRVERGDAGGQARGPRAPSWRAVAAVRAQGMASEPRTIRLVRAPAPSGGWGAERAVPGASYGGRRAMQARAAPAPDPRRHHAPRDSSARPPLSRADGGRAVALVYVAEGHASWPRAGAVVAHHLELGVVAVGRAHRPHAGLGAQHV